MVHTAWVRERGKVPGATEPASSLQQRRCCCQPGLREAEPRPLPATPPQPGPLLRAGQGRSRPARARRERRPWRSPAPRSSATIASSGTAGGHGAAPPGVDRPSGERPAPPAARGGHGPARRRSGEGPRAALGPAEPRRAGAVSDRRGRRTDSRYAINLQYILRGLYIYIFIHNLKYIHKGDRDT